MTPDTIRKATKALASGVEKCSDARQTGAAFGRALAALIKARGLATEQINRAAAIDIELSLLQMAASGDEILAEVADSALRELHLRPEVSPTAG